LGKKGKRVSRVKKEKDTEGKGVNGAKTEQK